MAWMSASWEQRRGDGGGGERLFQKESHYVFCVKVGKQRLNPRAVNFKRSLQATGRDASSETGLHLQKNDVNFRVKELLDLSVYSK